MSQLNRVRRFDVSPLRSPQRLPDGRLRVEGHISRTGIQVYRDANGNVRREYRPPEEVFHADAVASFSDVPMTDSHPPQGLITSKDARKVTVGYVAGHVRPDGDKLAASMTVIDADVAAKIEGGKRQLSCGYTCDYDPTPGTTPSGEKYDGVQRNIRGNHVALVDVGRAGPDVALRMDGDAWMDDGEADGQAGMEAARAARARLIARNQTGDSGGRLRYDAPSCTIESLREQAEIESSRARADGVSPLPATVREARARMLAHNKTLTTRSDSADVKRPVIKTGTETHAQRLAREAAEREAEVKERAAMDRAMIADRLAATEYAQDSARVRQDEARRAKEAEELRKGRAR